MRSVPSFSAILLFAALASFASGQENRPQVGKNSVQPKTDKEYFMAGHSLMLKKQYEDAVANFQRAIEINPKKKVSYDNLGFCLNQLHRHGEAIAALNQAIALDPKDSYAYFELGICYYDKKEFQKAIESIRQSIAEIRQTRSLDAGWATFFIKPMTMLPRSTRWMRR
jgi:tetratricopeptide (TPR) repeat protein